MNYKKLNVNIAAATFKGLSLSYQRKIAFFATLAIWLGVTYFGFSAALQYGESQFATDIAIISSFGMFVHYIFSGKFFLYTLARELGKLTPLAVLYRHDKAILDRGKVELLDIATSNDLNAYLYYARINPEIRSAENLQVLVHQKKGDLLEWTKNVRNLKKLANLVYQIHLVERFLAEENGING